VRIGRLSRERGCKGAREDVGGRKNYEPSEVIPKREDAGECMEIDGIHWAVQQGHVL